VRPSTRSSIAGKRTWRRRTQAFLVGIAALSAAASASADPNVSTKEAQARDVLAQIQQIDQSLGAAVEEYNLANVQLRRIEGDLRENRQQLQLARRNLKHSQKALAARLVAAYTSNEDNSTLAVVLGATSFEDMLNRVEALNSTARQDASIVRQVSEYKAAVERHRSELRTAHARQQDVVAQKAGQKQKIESRLATRRQMLSSIRGEIQRMKAAEAAQQRQLAASARSRLAEQPPQGPSADSVGVAASTPEGSTVAPPSGYSGIVGIAMRYLGVPYVWGGASPSGFDCSGLVQYAYAQLGKSVPHSTYALWPMGVAVSRSQLQPGDLVFFNGLGHMGIYIGNNQMIHAPHTGDVVKISSLTGWYASTYMGARRIG
jgi:cell wall-associated NlpC family hydrolase